MPIKVFCPRCQTGYNLADTLRGKVIQCKNCQRKIQVGSDSDDTPAAETRVQADRPASRVPPASQPRRTEVEEDDRPRRRRSDDYGEDDRPRRTKQLSQAKTHTGLVIMLCFLTGSLLAGGVIGGWYWLNRAPPAVVPAPVFPPPFDQARNNPGNNFPNFNNPNNFPNNFDNPINNAAPNDPNVPIMLSNPRCVDNGLVPLPTIAVDYRLQGKAPQFGGNYFLIIKAQGGALPTVVHLWNFDPGQAGTIRAGILGPLMGEVGPVNLHMEFGHLGHFANRSVVSNTVTLAADKLNFIPPFPHGGPMEGPPGIKPGLPPKVQPTIKPKSLDDAGITKALADLKTSSGIKREALLKDLAATPPVAQRQAEVANTLLEYVTNRDILAATAAAAALKTWATKEQVPALIKALDHFWPPVRQEVLKALTPHKDPRAIEPIVKLLDNLSDRDLASIALIAIGPPAEKAVLRMLNHQSSFTRSEACKVLGEIGGQESIGPLTEIVNNEMDSFVNRDASLALERIKSRVKPAQK